MTTTDNRAGQDRVRLASDLSALGLSPGRDVLVHCAMRRIGWIDGGAATLLAAIRDVVGDDSTIVVPTQTTINSGTSQRFRDATRGMTAEQVGAFQTALPGFDRASSPSEGMGVLAEYVRRHPGSVRSDHPLTSFAALGRDAATRMAVHDLDCHLGERSPMGGLYAADASILLLGVGYEACTALHLAEYRLTHRTLRPYRCYVAEAGRRVTREFVALRLDDSDFGPLGEALDGQPFVRRGRVGAAPARVLPVRAAVDFAVGWLTPRRKP